MKLLFSLLSTLVIGSCASEPSAAMVVNYPVESGTHSVLVFWQPWCGSCLAEMPALNAASSKHAAKLNFKGIVSGPDSSVDEDLMNAIIFENRLGYDTIRDRDGALSKMFDVSKTPTIVIVDSQQNVIFRGQHVPSDWLQYYPR
jgi:thiol-disulfide isomerase/thioredoxin